MLSRLKSVLVLGHLTHTSRLESSVGCVLWDMFYGVCSSGCVLWVCLMGVFIPSSLPAHSMSVDQQHHKYEYQLLELSCIYKLSG